MMEGFGVHTFRFVNADNKACFVKFHWKPLLGVHAVAWDEAQNISGKDPDFHRRDLWEAIENGDFPQWEFGVQIVPEEDEHKYEFDLLDPTKLIPEELVPVRRIGTLTLNRNPDNFFAETEQVAFHVGHIVPGIDFSNDPLLQGRLLSYTDKQLIRLGGPNFHEIPINRSIAPVHNNQRDGHMRQTINKGKTAHGPNGMNAGCPFQAGKMQGGFTSFPERIEAHKIRERSASFFDHFSQAKLFFNSQSDPERNHIMDALSFELGKVELLFIRERMLYFLSQIDEGLAASVAYNVGMHVPKDLKTPLNQTVPADADPERYRSIVKEGSLQSSAALSMKNSPTDSIQTRKIAILAADGVNDANIETMKKALQAAGATCEVIAPKLGFISGLSDEPVAIDKSLLTTASVCYDAVYVAGGTNCVATLEADADAVHFLNEAFKHCKAIAFDKEALQVIKATYFGRKLPADYSDESVLMEGVIMGDDANTLPGKFIKAIAQHRFWEREKARKVPA
jgi:catalase